MVSADDLVALRSNIGVEIAEWDEVVGKTLAVTVEADMPIEWSHIAS